MGKDVIGAALATAIGSIGLVVGLGFAAERAWFLSRAASASGTVVAMETSRWSGDPRTRHPVVEFAAADGSKHRVEGWSGRPPRHHMGNRVRVWYLPQDPDDARLDDPLELWLAPGVSGGVGLLLFGMGVVMALQARKRGRRP